MATKKQKQMLHEAVYRITNDLCNDREWKNLFEDTEANTNALILMLQEEIEKSYRFTKQVINNGNYMPDLILQYARMKNREYEEIGVVDTEPLENFLNKVDDINRFDEFTRFMDSYTWQQFNRYYIDPLRDMLDDLSIID